MYHEWSTLYHMSAEWKSDAGEWKWETASKGWALRMVLAQNLEELSLRKMGLAQKWDCGICQATDRLHLSLSRRLGWPLAAI